MAATTPRTITATVPAWITSNSFDPRKLIDGKAEEIIGALYYSLSDMTDCGWIKCGTAEITLTIHDEKEIVSNKIGALKAEKAAVLADAEAKARRIEGMIQELLCIEYKPEAA